MTEKKMPPRLTRRDFDSDAEYRAYLDIEAGGYDVPPLSDEERDRWRQVAANTLNPKRKRISIMVAERDLEKLKARALRLGMPYQTLINSVLHQYVEEG